MADNESPVTAEELDKTPQGLVRRWLCEWDLADKAESDWREEVEKVWELYKSKKPADNTFNILWSNTETLCPATYNSTPKPDVRRRFRDADPTGKVAATVLERTLTYELDQNDFDHTIQNTVLDIWIAGRGIAREKYEPKFASIEPVETEDDWLKTDEEPTETPQEEIADEKVPSVHVQWDSFRHGPGKTWDEVTWIGFEHCFTYGDVVRQFGEEFAKLVSFSEAPIETRGQDKDVRSLYKTAKFYEIWDKTTRQCLFIAPCYKQAPAHQVDDPLNLEGFWPLPRPAYAIKDTTSLVPQIPYKKYEQQAKELNRVTRRINKIVDALKVRGAYSAHLSEVKKIIEAGDNDMIAIENASEIANMGGLDKAIWLMPIDRLVQVLEGLHVSREKIIQSIYEITGMGDIMRGVSNPHETLGAQQLKSQWGSLRIQNVQRELQRFIRDLLRIKAEIISQNFQAETLEAMTGIQLPTDQEKQMLQMKAQQMQMSGMQVPPEEAKQLEKLMALPTWEEVMALLQSDEMRQWRIGIETDSTVSETLARDAQGMQESITAISTLFANVGPAVQQGVLSIDVVKTLALSMARTSRMGQAVEDAVEQMQQPSPQPGIDPEQQKMLDEGKKQVEQGMQEVQKGKEALQAEKEQNDMAAKAAEDQLQAQMDAIEKAKRDLEKQQADAEALIEDKLRELKAAKAELDTTEKLNAAAHKVRAAEFKANAVGVKSELQSEAVRVKDEAASHKEQVASHKDEMATLKSEAPKSADQVAALVETITTGFKEVAEKQQEVAQQQQEASAAAIRALAEAVTKPKSVRFAKGVDGSWQADSK